MKPIRRFIGTVPVWAYFLVLMAIFVISVYIYERGCMPMGGATVIIENGYFINDYVKPGGPVDRAGIKSGDTLVSMNSMPMEEWEAKDFIPKPGDTLTAGILKNSQVVSLPVILASARSSAPGFFWSIYIIMALFSAGSLFLLYKKPHDRAVWLLFIYIQGYIVTLNAQHLIGGSPLAMIASVIFQIYGCLLGPILIQFHLLFPKPTKIIVRYKNFPLLFYMIGAVLAVYFSTIYVLDWMKGTSFSSVFHFINRISLWWLTASFILALTIAVYRFFSIKDTLSRNQLRIVIIGAFFSCITPISINLFYSQINGLNNKFPYVIPLSHGIGGLIMISCILIAIFRYRIWNMEIFIKKALLYLGATTVIILSYLILLYLVDLLTISETNVTRFIILAISVIIFLILRDWIQRLIDRIFHRERYDSATVVSDFEEKLAGIYHSNELKSGIVSGLDEIFHFKTFVFSLKINEMMYEPAFILGEDHYKIDEKFEVSREFETKLTKSKVFSPSELDKNPPVVDTVSGELVIPLIKEAQPYGFFLCGPKMSEKTYSMQDIRVLTLIAKRVIALFLTAALYQKDLDRQLMLERERARISQDMHDDVGASLTRISMMSDLVKDRTDVGTGARQWLGQISDSSRGLMEEMNQIIWALNPKNDNLEGLIAYVRRFAFEYLEPTKVSCVFDLPEELPERALSVEVRRNVYLVAREALHNVVKHAGARKVWIKVEIDEQGFRIRIKDDGKGFDPGKVEFAGNGLINMKKRINDIGGELKIISQNGRGTEIEIVVRTV